MFNVLQSWFHKYFSDPQAVILLVLLVLGFTIVLTMGDMLAPALAALVLAYLLDGVVSQLTKTGLPRLIAVMITFLLFLGLMIFIVFTVFPLLWHQLKELFQQLPAMAEKGRELLSFATDRLPEYISAEQARELEQNFHEKVTHFGEYAFASTISSLPGVLVWMVYLILVPLLVFFFLKDKRALFAWIRTFLPKERHLASQVWHEMNDQISNYVRGKAIEIFIVAVVTYITFISIGLDYAAILAVITGFSVFIPYIGAAFVTLPVALIAFFQWGWEAHFFYALAAYGIIQALDGNLLVPLLFSEAVNLHPVAIIIAVLVFGGIWGFWGVFFAIPLATLVKAVLYAWPKVPAEVTA